jgi:O-antigen/teichoic acid export membrane protein
LIASGIRRARSLFAGLKSHDAQIHAHRAARIRRALFTGGITMLARTVQMGTALITIPLTLKYLGNERFGLWMTISSVLAMATFADFGIGNGVLNTVASASGRDDIGAIRSAVSSGFAVLTCIAALLMSLFFIVYRLVDWANVFGVVSPQARAEAGPAL